MTDETIRVIEIAFLVISRLERLSADSIWSHRASGVRGAMLKSIDLLQTDNSQEDSYKELARLKLSIDYGFYMLEKAARELIE